MSSIPNSAMPHAGPSQDSQQEQSGGFSLSGSAGRVADLVRENPKTAAAAGVAIAGAVAAAAIPLVRGRGKESSGGSSGKSSGKKS